MLRINNCLSVQDLDYIQSLPDVLLAKEKLANFDNYGSVYFKITLTDSLKSTLSTRLDLDLSNITEIPMRWIKGDTMRHKDKGNSEFTNTYLVYLTDSSGEFILGDTAFPIQKNTGFVFNEGILHETMNTGLMPRLLLGPMNEFAEPVGLLTAVYYYSTQVEAETASVTDDMFTLSENSLAVSSSYIVGRQNAMFFNPTGVAIDASGNMFVTDEVNQRIRKVSPSGIVTTLAGNGTIGFADAPSGPGTASIFNNPRGIAVDMSGNVFVTDFGNNRIRRVTPDGAVTTLAGGGNFGSMGYSDGQGIAAAFNNLEGIAIDASGNIFVADSSNMLIRKLSPPTGLTWDSPGAFIDASGNGGGIVTTIAGNRTPAFVDGTGTGASLSYPTAITLDASNNILVTDYGNNCIRRVTPGGVVSTITDSNAAVAVFNNPTGVAVDASGNIFVCENVNYCIKKMTANGVISTLAGSGSGGFADAPLGPGSAASFYYPYSITADTSGNIFVADALNNRIRKIVISSGAVTTLAGGDPGYKDNTVSLPTKFWKIAYSSTGTSPKVFIWDNGYMLNQSGTYFLYPAPPGSVCFLEGSTVLCFSEGKEQYLPVEKLTKGTLVKTLRDGYKRVELVAKEEMVNPGTDERIEQRLYKCSTSRYPELTSDLYITGCHSILVNTITDDEKAKLIKHLDRVFVTDRKYRLIACVDERAEPWNSEGTYTVWHFALENENIKMNYGVFVNGGLLVESCSKHVLKNKSDMVLL